MVGDEAGASRRGAVSFVQTMLQFQGQCKWLSAATVVMRCDNDYITGCGGGGYGGTRRRMPHARVPSPEVLLISPAL